MKSRLESLLAGHTVWIMVLLFIGCIFVSAVTPPLKSPDEHDHIERAYLFGKGVFVLDQPEGQASGGDVDTGFLQYLESYPRHQGKVSAEEIESANGIRWSGERVYESSPGTGYYFPVVYLPQAAGLWLGEHLGLTVDHSYRLARTLSLFSAVVLMFAAFRIHPPNPLVLALMAIPMSIYQFSSASLDGVSVALALLAISIFLFIARERTLSPSWSQYALAAVMVVLTTSRIHAFPMLLLLAATFFYTRSRKALYLFFISLALVVGWTFIAVKNTVDLRVVLNEPTISVIAFYLQNPFRFVEILWNTVADHDLREFYYKSFLGVLGWLDAEFKKQYYLYFGILVAAIAALSVSFRGVKDDWPQRLLLIVIALVSIVFIFFALLVTWTPHPADRVSGIQGRYFLIPALLLAYGFAGNPGLFEGLRRRVAAVLCLALFVLSVAATANLMVHRYYLADFKIEKVVYGPAGLDGEPRMAAGPPLSERQSVAVSMPPLQAANHGGVRAIGILFGTYRRQNVGQAEVVFRAEDGSVVTRSFSLEDLADNAYHYFKVPAGRYVSGEIRALSGGGVSVIESHFPDGGALTCLSLLSEFNQTMGIRGCP